MLLQGADGDRHQGTGAKEASCPKMLWKVHSQGKHWAVEIMRLRRKEDNRLTLCLPMLCICLYTRYSERGGSPYGLPGFGGCPEERFVSRSFPKHPCAASPYKCHVEIQSVRARTCTAPCWSLEGLFVVLLSCFLTAPVLRSGSMGEFSFLSFLLLLFKGKRTSEV